MNKDLQFRNLHRHIHIFEKELSHIVTVLHISNQLARIKHIIIDLVSLN